MTNHGAVKMWQTSVVQFQFEGLSMLRMFFNSVIRCILEDAGDLIFHL